MLVYLRIPNVRRDRIILLFLPIGVVGLQLCDHCPFALFLLSVVRRLSPLHLTPFLVLLTSLLFLIAPLLSSDTCCSFSSLLCLRRRPRLLYHYSIMVLYSFFTNNWLFRPTNLVCTVFFICLVELVYVIPSTGLLSFV